MGETLRDHDELVRLMVKEDHDVKVKENVCVWSDSELPVISEDDYFVRVQSSEGRPCGGGSGFFSNEDIVRICRIVLKAR